MSNQVLKVDVSGKPTSMISWQDYIRLYSLGKVNILAADEGFWRSPSTEIPKALIIQIPTYVKLKPLSDKHVPKKLLWLHYNRECQYCGKEITLREATKDHCTPKCWYKRNNLPASQAEGWTNITLSCGPCNQKKGDRTCAEANMWPTTTPKKPSYVQVTWQDITHPIQKEWVEQYFKVDFNTLDTIELPREEVL